MMLSVLLLCFGMGARADNVVSIGTASGAPGDEVTVSIGLQNSDAVSSLQVSIPLDERFSFVDGSASLGSRGNGHSVTAGVKDGEINIMVYSLGLAALAGNEGEVVTFRLKLGNQPSDIALTVSKLIVGDTSGNSLSATAQSGSVSIRCAKAQYSTMTVDFGSVPIRSTYTRNFTVTNVGNEPLEVTGLAFQNVMTKFSTSTQFPLTVAAGGSASLNITYAPDERGTVSETVKVLCNSISKLNNISLTAAPFAVNELHVQPASGYSDETVTVALNMNNMDAISGFQFEFNLPEALEFVPNSFVLSGRKQDHVVVSTVANGLLRIIGYSPSDKSLTGEDGELGTMQFVLRGRNNVTLKPSKAVLSATINNKVENVCSADYGATITIRSPRLSANSSLNMGRTPVTGDAVSNFVVRNYGNAPLTISRVLFDKEGFYIRESLPLTIDASRNATLTVVYPSTEEGDYQTTMQIYSNDPEQRLWNVTVSGHRFAPNYFDISTDDVSAFDNLSIDVSVNIYDPIEGMQFDLVYPSTYYEPFSNNYTLEPRAEGMTVTYRQIDAHTLRYFCYFLSGNGIAAGEGKVMTIELKPKGEYVPGGEYSVGVKEIKLGTSELADKYAGNDSESTFTVFYPVTSISIEPSPAALDKGQTLALVATVNEDATNKNVTWSSADESIVSVDAEGVVTGVEYGTTTITATSESNPEVTATCEVTVVYVPVTSISISQTTATLEGGETVKLIATVNEDASNKKIIWTSADSNVASVRADGTVVGLSKGTTIITGTSEANPELTVTCEVEVISDYSGYVSLPDAPFEFFYNAIDYDDENHSIPNHPLANLSDASLVLSNNIPEFVDDELLRFNDSCWGYIDRWTRNSTESGQYFYRSNTDSMTIVCKVSPVFGDDGNPRDLISNRGGSHNYMLRVGESGRLFLHTGTAFYESRSLPINDCEPQILAIRVDGKNDFILLQNLTTGESLRVDGVNWGYSDNVFRLFCSDSPHIEWYKGDFYWMYYSFEYLTDEQLKVFTKSILLGDVNGDGRVDEVDAQQIMDVSTGMLSLGDLAVPEAINVPGGNPNALEVNAQIVLDYSVASVKPW